MGGRIRGNHECKFQHHCGNQFGRAHNDDNRPGHAEHATRFDDGGSGGARTHPDAGTDACSGACTDHDLDFNSFRRRNAGDTDHDDDCVSSSDASGVDDVGRFRRNVKCNVNGRFFRRFFLSGRRILSSQLGRPGV